MLLIIIITRISECLKRRKYLFVYPVMVMLYFMGWSVPGGHAEVWVEDTFEDFADGILDASGQNIYVNRDGNICTIHRFDLNNDGYIDLLFNSTHNEYTFIPATLATMTKDRQICEKQLAVEGSLASEVVDLNRDGYPDIIFCPNPSGIQRTRRFVTIIWGGEDGWPSYRSNGILPVQGAKALTVADLNNDRWPDIVTLNQEAWLPGQPEGNIVRIYWGSEHGFLLSRYQDIGIQNALTLASGDFDSDGASDVAVLLSDGAIQIIWSKKSADITVEFEKSKISLPGNSVQCITAADFNGDGEMDLVIGTGNKALYLVKGKSGRSWDEPTVIEGFEASHIAAGDIDGDNYTDIVLSHFSLIRAGGGEMMGGRSDIDNTVEILWGSHKGFSFSQTTKLEAPYNIASTIIDLDGDGQTDIICAIHQGEKFYATESAIFFGKGKRQFERCKKGIHTEGAYHVAAVPSQNNLPNGVIFSNSRGGNLHEEVPLLLYWGGPYGFDPDRRLEIPFRSGYEATAADINADGFVDLIAVDEMHGGQTPEDDPYHGVNIFWGGMDGFDFENRRTVINEQNAGTTNVADLNRDGYLDLVIGFFNRSDGNSTELIIIYGSADGIELGRREAIPCEGRSNSPVIADYDRDGWLDIAVNSSYKDLLRIFRGGPEGFSEKNQSIIEVPFIIDLETADLNSDGYLDIIACSYIDNVQGHSDTGVFLFWGSPEGFRHWNCQWLPGFTTLGPVVADFDNDGFLDLFCPNYHGELTRELIPSYLYWGGAEGFHPRRRTPLINDSASDGLAADFNRDGFLDLAVSNHTVDGNHNAFSKVFYNDGNRFINPRIEKLPTHGPHWMWNEDMGHIYDRKWRQTYISSTFQWKQKATKGSLNFEADMPTGTKLVFAVRSAVKKESLENVSWKTVDPEKFVLDKKDRCLQYKAIFISDNGDRFPVLDRVTIEISQ